ncbi:MAG TPA: hypothetical protein VF092_28650 [Longimicrobium sp.]
MAPASALTPRARLRAFAASFDRGMLLDVVVFALNLLVMRRLAREFVAIARHANAGDAAATRFLGIYFLLMLVLPAAGAVLTRWHFHRRRAARGERGEAGDASWGCLLNPAFFLSVSLVLTTVVAVVFTTEIFGDDISNRAEIFLPTILGVMVFAIAQTVLVYRYLSPPSRPPRAAFLRDERGLALGDACIFLNMILFQVLWNVMMSGRFAPPTGVEDLLGRLFFLWFASILVYFPPRIFYLAEDGDRGRAWATMALANTPLVLHAVFGVI